MRLSMGMEAVRGIDNIWKRGMEHHIGSTGLHHTP